MYIDISLRKLIPLSIIAVVLMALLFTTFAAKDRRFGSTPFYSAVALGWQQITGYTLYPAERALRGFFASLFGVSVPAPLSPGEAAGVPVITYHRLVSNADGANVTFGNFKDQMEELKSAGWDTITLKQYEAYMRGETSLPERSVLVTFDDGAKQSFYPVDPILKDLGFNAVNYIIVGDSVKPETTYYLSPQEIKNMLSTGRWEIGSHSSAGHTPYPVDERGTEGHFFSDKLWLANEGRLETDAEFRARVADDLATSRRDLESTYGVTIDGFAFPFGDTGETSVNYPESHGVVVAAADDVYTYGWVQPGAGQYTYNYPHEDAFLMRRIRVAPDWNGEDLVRALERGIGKPLPYEAALGAERSWLSTWGDVQTLPDGTLFSASDSAAGASAFLDGTGAWHDYEARFSGEWTAGFAVVMASLTDAAHYRDCAFNDGEVSIRSVAGSERTTLARAEDSGIVRGEDVALGIRVQGGTVQCLFNERVVLETRGLPQNIGGIGLQVWHPERGTAEFLATRVAVRDISHERLISPTPVRAPTQADSSAQTDEPAIPNTGTGGSVPLPQVVSTGAVTSTTLEDPHSSTTEESSRHLERETERKRDKREEAEADVRAEIERFFLELMKKREEARNRRLNNSEN